MVGFNNREPLRPHRDDQMVRKSLACLIAEHGECVPRMGARLVQLAGVSLSGLTEREAAIRTVLELRRTLAKLIELRRRCKLRPTVRGIVKDFVRIDRKIEAALAKRRAEPPSDP